VGVIVIINNTMSGTASRVPILRILGGLLFILAGVALYLRFTITSSIALLFILGGAAVILLAVSGHRASGGDVVAFVLGILVLGAFITPGIVAPPAGAGSRVTYTVPRSAILNSRSVVLLATTDVGSISISYSKNSSIGYQVNFTESTFLLPFQLFSGHEPSASLTNRTQGGGALVINATARAYDISVGLGTGIFPPFSVNASTGTGNIDVKSQAAEAIGNVSLESGTGMVTANLTSKSTGAITLQTGTGGVTLQSSDLAPDGQRVPIDLSSGTGTVDLDVKLAAGTAVSLNATTGLGSVSHDLRGFTLSPGSSKSNLEGTAGDVETASTSFIIRVSTGTGLVTTDAQFLG
jgi:hypothetical protein